jgi:hypothetical protein
MATLATLYDRIFSTGGARGSESAVWQNTEALVRTAGSPFALRALPNEDILFFSKRIDNSRVVAEVDPQTGGIARRLVTGSLVAGTLFVLLLLPSAWGRLAGYSMENLRQERERLVVERASLVYEEAQLLSPQRLEHLSSLQQLIDPEPESVHYLEPKSDGVLAMAGTKTAVR